jgi:hypothetical protein
MLVALLCGKKNKIGRVIFTLKRINQHLERSAEKIQPLRIVKKIQILFQQC